MLGIHRKPFIDLEPYIDIFSFRNLDLEICRGIAKSPSTIGCTSTGNLEPLHTLREAVSEFPIDESWNLNANEQRVFTAFYKPVTNNVDLIYLRKSEKFLDRNRAEKNFWTENANHFPELVKAVEKLPFKELGRVVLYKSFINSKTPIHSDTDDVGAVNDFIWLNPRRQKQFFVFDATQKTKHYISSAAAWFNELDFHGTEPSPNNTYSIRVDGVFADDFKSRILAESR